MDDGHATDRPERATSGASTPVLLVVAASAVLAVTVLSLLALGDARRDVERAETAARSSDVAADLAGEINRLGDVVRDLSSVVVAAGPEGIARRPVQGLRSVEFLPRDPDRVLVDQLLAEGIDVVALRPTLDQARDGDGAVLLAPPNGSPPASVLVDAVYRTDDGRLSQSPSDGTTATRRSQLAGFVVAVVDLDALVPAPPVARWQLTDGPVVLRGETGPLGDSVVSTDVDVFGRRWVLTGAVPGSGRPPASTFALALTGLVGLVVLAVAARRSALTLAQRGVEVATARRRASAIVTLSGVVQQSHDLGEILPGLAVQLSDTLGLEGLTLSLATTSGSMREIFAHGVRPDAAATVAGDLVEVAAGETLVLHLHRAERSIAVLRVVTGRTLDVGDLDLLHIAAEMITSTVVTARSSEQQQEAVARLQTLDELKTAFLGTASHELRTPVTAISGFAFVLAERWDSLDDAERRVFAERIASNARALDALVQDLLDFARLERGDHAILVEPLDLSDLVRQTLERLAPVWQTHRIEQQVDPGCWVEGDRAALERVITNLVSNAVKFSPDDAAVRVTVRRGEQVELMVDDQGPGVPPGERDKIFVRFFRGSSQAVVRTRGVGIGLSVVEDFVHRMHGRIVVGDSPEGGARFLVSLPSAASPPAVTPADPVPDELEEHDVPSP